MKNTKAIVKRSFAPLLAGFLSVAVSHTVYSLELPSQPLLLSEGVEPNVMVVLDDSGSMVIGFYYGDYESDTTYVNCPSSITLPATYTYQSYSWRRGWQTYTAWYEIEAKTDANGNAYFVHNNTSYAWGSSSGTDATTGLPKRCFGKNTKYKVQYSEDFNNYSNPGSQIDDNDDHFDGEAGKGNFWNYYFSNDDQTGVDNWGEEDQKFGVGERIEIAQDAAKLLVRSVDDIRIGLAGFEDNNDGGRVLVNIDSIDEVVNTSTGKTHADQMIEQINDMIGYNGTPLGETLFDMGRYFVEGKEDQDIVLHPAATDTTNSTGTQVTRTASSVFSSEPRYQGAASKPTEPVIEAYCQKSYVVMLTDGDPSVDGDGDIDSDIEDYASSHNDTNTNGSNAIFDDVALALYDIDLRPDLVDLNGEAVRNNITTYLIAGFGLETSTLIQNTVDNGKGVGVDINEDGSNATSAILYQADDGNQLTQSFEDIFQDIASDSGAQTAVTFNSGSLEDGAALYQATYARVDHRWSGDLQAYLYDTSNSVFSDTSTWSAAEQLDDRVSTNGHGDRIILTYSKSDDGVAFTEANWNQLSSEQQDDLKGDGNAAHGKDVLNYLRGESNSDFRDRASYESDGTTVASLGLLGDMVNSSPMEVGEPELGYPDYGDKASDGSSITQFGTASESYSDFAKDYENRDSVVYVGSNDGMLHAFDGDISTGGKELFAYIPGLIFDSNDTEEGLYYLTDEDYEHKFYVDGPLTASDVYIDPAGGSNRDWRTVIAGGLRAGGRGLYALDVTDPSQFSASNAEDMVLWEFGADDSANMGHIYGRVRFSMMNNGKWAAIVGNGYNSASGEAKLFIIYIEEGADGTWDAGDWVELGTGVTGDNGMSAPVLADFNGDRIVDRIYAGDLKGNLWVYDVSDASDANWATAYGSALSPSPLFVAEDASGNAQPITTQPSVILNPGTSSAGNGYNALVYIGTGKLLERTDFATTDTMSFYAVWDRGDGGLERDNLTPRTLVNSGASRAISGDEIPWTDGTNGTAGGYGWRVDFPEAGERLSVDPNITGGSVLFTTSLPTTSVCENGGTGWLISLDWNGLSFTVPTVDIDGDGVVDDDDIGLVGVNIAGGIPSGSATIASPEGCADGYVAKQVANTNSAGETTFTAVCSPSGKIVGRMSWQDILRR